MKKDYRLYDALLLKTKPKPKKEENPSADEITASSISFWN
jgi:hypothetical protein